jgi:two-component system response regulator NreC
MSTTPPIRLIVVDDHEVVLVGLKALFCQDRTLELIGSAANSDGLVKLARSLRPDVIIMEIRMLAYDGLETIRLLASEVPETKVLIYSKDRAPFTVLAALQAGALAYISKFAHCSVLMAAIPMVAKGKRFIDPELIDPMLRVFLDDQIPVTPSSLSKREREVLIHIAWGFTNSVIAETLNLSTKTVESYRMRACEKLTLPDRPAIVKFALMSGWLDRPVGIP